MEKKKRVLMIMPVMKGGGAERVAALLMNAFYKNKYDVQFLLTSSKPEEVINRDLDSRIPLLFLQEQMASTRGIKSYVMKGMKVYSSVFCRLFEKMGMAVPSHFAYWSFVSQYYREIDALEMILLKNPDMTVITFLQPSIPMVLLAAKKLPNRIIISERGNPERLMKHRYGRKFIEKYYRRADAIVFQTEDAKHTYPECEGQKRVVISNPIKSNLPKPYLGERNKNITTFCRISLEKNLNMLLDSFVLFSKEYPEYKLRIIGDALNKKGKVIREGLIRRVNELKLNDRVEFLPFSSNVHKEILEDSMYINTSDYEGMSNAMLESMALGIPVICTDCPIGGARTIIRDRENGFLVPVGDVNTLYRTMKEMVENKKQTVNISLNATKIRNTLSLDNIAKKWMELV